MLKIVSNNLHNNSVNEFSDYLENSSKISNESLLIRNFYHQKNMKIFNLISYERYFTFLDEDFRREIYNRYKDGDTNGNLEISKPTLNRIIQNKNYPVRLSHLFNLCEFLGFKRDYVEHKIKTIKTKNSSIIEIGNFKVSKSLMRILGHLLGDGGIHIIENEKKFRAFYVNNERVLLESFECDVKELFGDFKLYFRERIGHGDEIWLPNTQGLIFYNLLEYGKNNHKKRVPAFIFDLDEDLICSLLQALYDDEGFLYPKKNMIVISQAKRDLVCDIKNLLTKVGIKTNPIRIHKSKNRTEMHYFSITHKNNILKFYEKINFKHPVKKEKLNILVDKYR